MQKKRKKLKYMNVCGYSVNNERIPSSSKRKAFNKTGLLKQLAQKNHTMVTEPEWEMRNRILDGPCRPWSSKKMLEDYNIIF